MFCSKICFEDSVQRSFPMMCFKDFVLWWDSRSGPPAFGSLWYVVEQYDGTTWNTICYYDAYMEAHRAMLRFEKSNIGDQIKEIYRASHVSGHIPAMPALLQPTMAHDVWVWCVSSSTRLSADEKHGHCSVNLHMQKDFVQWCVQEVQVLPRVRLP